MRISKVIFLSRGKPVVVKPDATANGKPTGRFEFRQGEDYVMADEIEATYLHRMGYQVVGEGFTIQEAS